MNSIKLKKLLRRFLVVVVLLFVVYKCIQVSYNYLSERYSCHLKWSESGLDYKYTFKAGCLISKDGNWIPVSNFKVE